MPARAPLGHTHLAILSALAADKTAGRLHTRHLQVIALLAQQHGNPVPVGQIAELLKLPSNAVTRACDRLDDLGLIVRGHPDNDRRAVVVSITPTGVALNRRVATAFAITGAAA
jgi:DNA-binding MarR family transcriptional regulator